MAEPLAEPEAEAESVAGADALADAVPLADADALPLAEPLPDAEAETDSEASLISRTVAPSSVPLHEAATTATAREPITMRRKEKRCMVCPFVGLSNDNRIA